MYFTAFLYPYTHNHLHTSSVFAIFVTTTSHRTILPYIPMYVETVPNRNSRPAYLIRQGKRQGNKVVKTTLANISKLPDDVIQHIRVILRGCVAIENPPIAFKDTFTLLEGSPHGHVAATLGTLRTLGLDRILAPKNSRNRRIALALVCARILEPQSKLATSAALHPDSATSTLGSELGLGNVDEDDLYQAMDWLLQRKSAIETQLAQRHLEEGSLVLCDVTSTYLEAEALDLAAYGYSRDRKKGKKQITFGLLTNREGCPVAVEVFSGNTADPSTLAAQIAKIQQQFDLRRIVLVGDRGLLTEARIQQEVKPAGFDWISALKKSGIRKIVEQEGLQLDLFDERNLAEVSSEAYPGERIILCRNPHRAQQSARAREELLCKTEEALDKIVAATRRKKSPVRSVKTISFRAGKVLGRWKMAKHFVLQIKKGFFRYERNEASIRQEAALDGMYAIRTSLQEPEPEQVVADYKRLSAVEAAFRSLKTVDLKVRPIRHWKTPRVICHIFLCMLAYYVQWHMLERLAPMLFAEDDPEGKRRMRKNVVEAARRSDSAKRKARTKRTATGQKALSFASLMAHLATLCKHKVGPRTPGKHEPFTMLGGLSELQARAFELLDVKVK